ncbi:MAG: tRNA (adenosine(37)-N6)-dimethylallyltransferase MiaA [Flavobacteriales bacterium]|nr:tRNA (adenosine(37)-N6)-dimethylallyltransferase MiaA [Flavobacteriales bacterium]OUW94283.1 MAG: tRNA (adenosine(37)-N6)-dimethylallyltransferase MiaA [Flavobacteriales bacterium TMED228]|tara:strand:- start:4858 stop:5760 length:903 start_codon:yes stop_codon:yes gene_type:complete
MSTTKKLFVILGPTASGKTALSIQLSKELNAEIISCDSRQFYKELNIGAAPPSKNQLKQTKHHFIQHLSIKDNYNIGQYEKDAIKKIYSLFKIYNNLILVGGSGLYINAICNGIDDIPETPQKIRNEINNVFLEKGIIWLQEKVKKIDLDFYKNSDTNNPQRLKRCLEVYLNTGQKISSFYKKNKIKRDFKIIKIGISTEREALYNKINHRVDQMIKNGLINEAKELFQYQKYNALNTVGYKELFSFFEKKIDKEIAIEEIKKNSRRLAKRQITWFKRDKEINWFNINKQNEIIKFILKS